jgi:integrase/recombinase XerD
LEYKQEQEQKDLIQKKIQDLCEGIPNAYVSYLRSIGIKNNITIIVKYISTMKTELNLSSNYKKDLIKLLTKFSNYCNKDFRDITRDDIISFLESFRKSEIKDPLHKWIGTYNIYRVHLLRFFKWFYSPNAEPTKRTKPSIIDNIPKLRRKEISIYKPSDMWTAQDDLLFFKYCPSKRDSCYHAISRDLSARPHEILKLKIKDIAFKTAGSSQYVEVVVNGKTGRRPIPLINSIPFLKDYLDHEHPQPNNPNAPLICGTGKSLGKHMTIVRIGAIYAEYKNKIFPKLLENPNVLPEDKQKVKELLKKPWNSYIRRHSALTEKSTILKEHVLRQHAGWSGRSQMHLKYLHYYGNESNESLLEAYGIIDKGIQIDQLRPKQCPNCNEPNKVDSKFCVKCRMVLSYDAYEETLENQKKKEDRLTTIESQFNTMQSQIQLLLSSLGTMKDQNQVNQLAKTLFDSRILNQASGRNGNEM